MLEFARLWFSRPARCLVGPRGQRLGLLVGLLLFLVWPAPAQPTGKTGDAGRPTASTATSPRASAADLPAVRTKLFQAATLANSFKDSEALGVYQEILKLDPAHYLALWQAAVLSIKIGSRYSDETRKSAYFDAARQYAERALVLRPEGGESNYAVALALFNQATLYKAGARLEAFRDLRSHVYLATEHRPDLPETWQLLGRWQYRVSHYNLLERLYSKLVLGGVPSGGDSREAMADLEKAVLLAPQSLPFHYDLARMYIYQGRRQAAIAILQKAQQIPAITSEDLVILRQCRKLLPRLVRANARRQRRQNHIGRLTNGRRGSAPSPANPAPAPSPADSLHR
ncbi:MAG: tetratricopeptide repeat protein [Bacteroidota bacterium]|nr:tetratricopeptide repeat protein [Bacteroidota bacterium]